MQQTEADPALDPAPDFLTQDAAMDPWSDWGTDCCWLGTVCDYTPARRSGEYRINGNRDRAGGNLEAFTRRIALHRAAPCAEAITPLTT